MRWLAINVLHLLDHSLPEQDGYSYRSHAILDELKRQGITLTVLTGPKQGALESEESEVDGIRYERTPVAPGTDTSGVVGQVRTVVLTRRRVREALRANTIDVVHAHSPCLNGLAVLGLGIPFVYEMRSSWEDAAVSVGSTRKGSLRYRLSRSLETFVVRRADRVVVISEGLRSELMSRGVPEDRISLVPNALPTSMFDVADRTAVEAVRHRFRLENSRVIGFFGSFFEWEGVDELVKAMPAIVTRVPNAHLLLAGGGRREEALEKLVADLGLSNYVTFAGRVSHEQVKAFYGVADIMAYPRVSDRLTNMVTPLKPLEAMAQGAVVVASDVGGHRELISDGRTGFLYPAGDISALAQTVSKTLVLSEEADDIRENAVKFVRQDRQWSVVSRQYGPLYRALSQMDG